MSGESRVMDLDGKPVTEAALLDIRGLKVRHCNGDARKRRVRCSIDHTVFAPVRAAADKLERLPDKRVEGMRDANQKSGRPDTSCS